MANCDESSFGDGLTPAQPNKVTRTFYTQPKFEEMYSRVLVQTPKTFQQRSAAFTKQAGRKIREAYCGKQALKNEQHEDLRSDTKELPEGGDEAQLQKEDPSAPKLCKVVKCNLLQSFLLRLFPFVNIMQGYDIRNWLANDLVAGFTVGVMHIPQGMAYAMLATLPPVYGLYCSMFAPLFYFFLGTSRHVSVGTIAIISLLTGGALDRTVTGVLENSADATAAAAFYLNLGQGNGSVSGDHETVYRVLLATALTMSVGITQLIMGVLRLGILARFLSDPMITGFTVGSAVHVAFSQLATVLGLSIRKRTGIFNIPLKIYDICINLPKTNLATLGLSLTCIVILYIFKRWINPRIMRKFKVPVPIELLIVIFGAVVAYQLDLEAKNGLKVVGHVPSGFPVPMVPNLALIPNLFSDVIVIALIAFSISYSLASVFARQEGYEVDANQEMIAFGLTNIFSSFFHTYPQAASLSRTALQVTMNGMTQIVGLVSSVVVLFVILFAGPLFYTVPNCCLSAIILVALQSMFMQMTQLPGLWKYSIWDFAIWILTFLATSLLDVIYGLLLGIAFSALFVLIRAQLQKAVVLGRLNNSEVFKPIDVYTNCETDPEVKVIRYESDIFYAAADHFTDSVINAVGFDPRPLKCKKIRLEKTLVELNRKLNKQKLDDVEFDEYLDGSPRLSPLHRASLMDKSYPNQNIPIVDLDVETVIHTLNQENNKGTYGSHCCPCPPMRSQTPIPVLLSKRMQVMNQLTELLGTVPLTHIILDCSAWNFIDIVGIEALKSLLRDYECVGIRVYLAACSKSIQDDFKNCSFYDEFDPSILFISVYDAFMWIVNVDRKAINSSELNTSSQGSGDPAASLDSQFPEKKSILEQDL